ncbi:MAG: hypothetical protein ACOC32_04520 [Nanoarchaeota archaeon]
MRRTTKLPLWYLIGVIVVVLTSVITYLGVQHAMSQQNIELALKFQYMDYLLIGSWLVVNIIMIFFLMSKDQTRLVDYLFPVYFILLHLFYVAVILMSYNNIYLPTIVFTVLSFVTSAFELGYSTYLIIPFVHMMNETYLVVKKGTGSEKEVKKEAKKKATTSSIRPKRRTVNTKINKRKKSSKPHARKKRRSEGQ